MHLAKLQARCYSGVGEGAIAGRQSISGDRNPAVSISLTQCSLGSGKAELERQVYRTFFAALAAITAFAMTGCGGAPELPPAPPASSLPSTEYRIGAGGSLYWLGSPFPPSRSGTTG
jgi:hypothetical protein